MEECDELCGRLGIMVNGRLQCVVDASLVLYTQCTIVADISPNQGRLQCVVSF